jgi:hypothetical protein
VKALAVLEGKKVEALVRERGFERYFGFSVKGEASVNWDNEKAEAGLSSRHRGRCLPGALRC